MFGLWEMEANEDGETCPRSLGQSGNRVWGNIFQNHWCTQTFCVTVQSRQGSLLEEPQLVIWSFVFEPREVLLVPVVGPQLLVL